MRPWWPERAQRAWRSMTPARRMRGRLLIEEIEASHFGFAASQAPLVRDVARSSGESSTVVLDALVALRRQGILRRRRYREVYMVWVPEPLLAPGVPAREEGVWTEWDPWTHDGPKDGEDQRT